MIKLRNILFEQEQDKEKLNVLFITDYPTDNIGNFAKRLIATHKVTGTVKSYSKQDSSEAVSLLAHNISTEYDLIVTQISGVYDKNIKDLIYNLNRINIISERKKIPVVFIATPTLRFASMKRDLDFIDHAYDAISRKAEVIELPEIIDNSYFDANGFILNKSGQQLVFNKILQYLKTLDSDIEITPEDSEEMDTGNDGNEPSRMNRVINKVIDKIKTNTDTLALPIGKAKPGRWQDVMAYLIGKGLTKEGAAGVAGNMKIESNFNPGAVGDKGTSYGICQWHASRKTALINFAKAQGKPVDDMNMQLDYLWKELTAKYSNLVSILKTTTDPRDAAQKFAEIFERPAHISNKRLNYAQQYSESYDSGSGLSTGDIVKTGISLMSLAGLGSDSKGKPVKVDGKNGKLPTSQLKSVGGGHVLHPAAADAYLKMKSAYEAEHKDPKTGKITKTFKLSDSYRSFEGQNKIFDWDLYKRTGKNKKIGTGGTIAAAYPGTSNHGWGKAIDVGPTHARKWIQANGMKYGWSWDEGKRVGEPWHFTYVK